MRPTDEQIEWWAIGLRSDSINPGMLLDVIVAERDRADEATRWAQWFAAESQYRKRVADALAAVRDSLSDTAQGIESILAGDPSRFESISPGKLLIDRIRLNLSCYSQPLPKASLYEDIATLLAAVDERDKRIAAVRELAEGGEPVAAWILHVLDGGAA